MRCGASLRSANAADAPAPPEPFGRIGVAGNLFVARRRRCPASTPPRALSLPRKPYARDPLYFYHGLLALLLTGRFCSSLFWYGKNCVQHPHFCSDFTCLQNAAYFHQTFSPDLPLKISFLTPALSFIMAPSFIEINRTESHT